MVHSLDHLGYILKNKAVLSPIVTQLIKKKKKRKEKQVRLWGCFSPVISVLPTIE